MGDLEDYHSLSQIIDFVYKKTIRAGIMEPTVIYNYPALLIPLARRNDNDQLSIRDVVLFPLMKQIDK